MVRLDDNSYLEVSIFVEAKLIFKQFSLDFWSEVKQNLLAGLSFTLCRRIEVFDQRSFLEIAFGIKDVKIRYALALITW